MEDKVINLLVTIDKNYITPFIVMLKSYVKTNSETSTILYVAHSSLEDNDINKITSNFINTNIEFKFIKVDENIFKEVPLNSRKPIESYYNIIAFHYLPKEVTKVLYLDPDVIINKSILDLYNLDISRYYIAGGGHNYGFLNFVSKIRLGLGSQKRYINSGVLLMNISKIREDFSLKDILDSLEINRQRLMLGSSDLINILFGEKMYLFDEKIYNLDERSFKHFLKKKTITYEDVLNNTAIIHYSGKYKPWNEGYKGKLLGLYPEIEEKGPAPKKQIKKDLKSIYSIIKPNKQQKTLIFTILFVLVAAIVLLLTLGDEIVGAFTDPTSFRTWLDQFGPFDEIIYIVLRSIQTCFKYLPSVLFEVMAGYGWGFWLGVLYSLIGNMIGTGLIFLLSKKFGTKLLDMFIPVSSLKTFEIFRDNKRIYLLLFIFYLIPEGPKDLLIYFIALLPINFWAFLIVSSIGRIPSIMLITYAGTSLAEQNYGVAILLFFVIIGLAIAGGFIYKHLVKKHKHNKESNLEI